MKQTKDYKNYDYIEVSVKEKHSLELEKTYLAFSWERVSCEGHKRYYDLVNYTFRRPHLVDKKDELQYLQVCAERELNERDKLESRKHAASTILGLTTGVLGALFFLLGIFLAIKFSTKILVLGIVFAVLGAGILVGGAFAVNKTIKKENARFRRETERSLKKTDEILSRAKALKKETL